MVNGVRGFAAVVAVAVSLFGAPAFAQGVVFQPAYHQALRWSEAHGSVMTYRLKVPVGRAGSRMRFTFMAGDGAMTIHKVTVARVNGGGAVAATFNGAASATASARQRIKTDPVSFPVSFGEEVFVSFEASGQLAVSSILALPGSFRWSGRYAATFPGPAGGEWARSIALSTVEVEGPSARAFVALGDSITEGYIAGDTFTNSGLADDYRKAWPTVMQANVGLPVANAGVAGQGIFEALENLDREVKSLSGVTDCVVLLGTNDLATATSSTIETQLQNLISRLNGFCRVWMSTLLPKEGTSEGSYAEVVQRRHEVNAWIRGLTSVAGVIDLEAVTRDPANVDKFKAGYKADYVHPSALGHEAMGKYAADFFAAPSVNAMSPDETMVGTTPALSFTGRGFRPGLSVRIGGKAATGVRIVAPYSVTAVAPKLEAGKADVELINADGTRELLADAFDVKSPEERQRMLRVAVPPKYTLEEQPAPVLPTDEIFQTRPSDPTVATMPAAGCSAGAGSLPSVGLGALLLLLRKRRS